MTHLIHLSVLALALSLALPSTFAATLNNVVFSPTLAYASAGPDGIAVLSATGKEQSIIPPPPSFAGIHDLSVADLLLFALDAASGNIAVYSLADPSAPSLLSGSSQQSVEVSTFSGVSAGGGKVAVSGGTSRMSVFSYSPAGALTALTRGIDLGTGQPDVLVDGGGDFAYVSTDFSGRVDGQAFGITALDLNSADLAAPATNEVGLKGAGFTDGRGSPANFPIESAIAGGRLLVAHGGGLSVLDLADKGAPKLVETLGLDFDAVSVDAEGDTAVVVGADDDGGPAAARVNLKTNKVVNLVLPKVDGAGEARGVAVRGETVLVAAGELVVCNGDCEEKASSGGGGGGGGSGDGDKACVEEGYLLAKGVSRSALLHAESSVEDVYCVGRGLPCGTKNHVVRFAHEYLTYGEACERVAEECTRARKRVNGVSMRYARHLCGAGEAFCVIPHVMRTGLEVERTVIRLLHTSITG